MPSEEYPTDKERLDRFIADALGEGNHHLHGFISGYPPLGVDVRDFGATSELGQVVEVKILHPDAESISLENIADHIAEMRGLISTYLLPEASETDYQLIKASIARYGVRQPILTDENGQIINGRLRKRACDELGIECPSEVGSKMDYVHKQQLAVDLDMCRKHFKSCDKKRLAYLMLKSSPSDSDRMIGDATKLDHKTVGELRATMVRRGEIPHLNLVKGKDNKMYRFPSIRCKTAREAKKAATILKTLGPDAPNRELRPSRLTSLMQERLKKVAIENGLAPHAPDDHIQLLHQDFRTLNLADDSVNLFFTDPPYLTEFMSYYGDLAEIAARALKPGGLLLTYIGTHHINSAIDHLSKHLQFHWQYVVQHSGASSVNYVRKVFCNYKSILAFSKGAATPLNYVRDSITGQREKKLHKWQQSVFEAKYYIGLLTKPGDLIVDCFGGSFTTAEAVVRLGGRRFIGCDIEDGCVAIGLDRIAKVRAELANETTSTEMAGGHEGNSEPNHEPTFMDSDELGSAENEGEESEIGDDQ